MKRLAGLEAIDPSTNVATWMQSQINTRLSRLLTFKRPDSVFHKLGKLRVPKHLHAGVGTPTGLENDRIDPALFLGPGSPRGTARRVAGCPDCSQCGSTERDSVAVLQHTIDFDGLPAFIAKG